MRIFATSRNKLAAVALLLLPTLSCSDESEQVTAGSAPVVFAGVDREAVVGETVSLSGEVTDDGGIGNVTVSWSLVESPEATPVSIMDGTSVIASAVLPLVGGTYRFRLEAEDIGGNVGFDEVTIFATCTPEPDDSSFCQLNAADCGSLTRPDRCGAPRTVLCGVCSAGSVCGFAGEANLCGGIAEVSAGRRHTCARSLDGRVRCWGYGAVGALGYGNAENIGDDEAPRTAGDLPVGGVVRQIVTGDNHSCALLEGGSVRCWGANAQFKLGYADVTSIGTMVSPSSVPPVDIGGTAIQIAVGDNHTCVLLDTNNVRCWGGNSFGELGYGTTELFVGDDETPADAGDIDVGGPVIQIAAGRFFTCALLETKQVRCWGRGTSGRLGYGNENNVGDDEVPADVGDIDLGDVQIEQVVVGGSHACARSTTGGVYCWGEGRFGQLGYGREDSVGDDEDPVVAGEVALGSPATQISAGEFHTCAVLATNKVRCWGRGRGHELGYIGSQTVGDDETPSEDVNTGADVVAVSAGGAHTCALLITGDVLCWGSNLDGQLGIRNTDAIGDNEVPSDSIPSDIF